MLQDGYRVVLMCALSIELVWVEKYGKMGEKQQFLGIFKGWYQYHKCSGRLVPVPKSRYRYPMFYFGSVLVFWP